MLLNPRVDLECKIHGTFIERCKIIFLLSLFVQIFELCLDFRHFNCIFCCLIYFYSLLPPSAQYYICRIYQKKGVGSAIQTPRAKIGRLPEMFLFLIISGTSLQKRLRVFLRKLIGVEIHNAIVICACGTVSVEGNKDYNQRQACFSQI